MRKTSFQSFLSPTLIMFILGWGGLYILTNFTLPTASIWLLWAFFFLATFALTGTALPIIYSFHRRFTKPNPPPDNVILRQALWVGFYGATLAWLQLGRAANISIVIGLGLGLIAIEALIRLREKSQWTPPQINND